MALSNVCYLTPHRVCIPHRLTVDKPAATEEAAAYDMFNNSPSILSPSLVSRLSPPALDSPPLMMAGTPQLNTPSPPQSPPNSWVQRQLQAALLQQYVAQTAPISTPVQPAVPQLTSALQPLLPQQQLALLAHFQRQQQTQLHRPYDTQQMMSLLMDEKRTHSSFFVLFGVLILYMQHHQPC